MKTLPCLSIVSSKKDCRVLEVKDACKGRPCTARRVGLGIGNHACCQATLKGPLHVDSTLHNSRPSICSSDVATVGVSEASFSESPFLAHFGSTGITGPTPLRPQEVDFEYVGPNFFFLCSPTLVVGFPALG